MGPCTHVRSERSSVVLDRRLRSMPNSTNRSSMRPIKPKCEPMVDQIKKLTDSYNRACETSPSNPPSPCKRTPSSRNVCDPNLVKAYRRQVTNCEDRKKTDDKNCDDAKEAAKENSDYMTQRQCPAWGGPSRAKSLNVTTGTASS